MENFTMSLKQVVDLIMPNDKDNLYKQLFISLMVKSPDQSEFKKEKINSIKKRFPSVSKVQLNKLSFIEITLLENFINTFFRDKDINDFISLKKKESIEELTNRFKDYPSKKFNECVTH